MSPLKRKKLSKILFELDKLDNSLIKLIKKRTNLVKKVLALKDKKNQIVDQKRIHKILKDIKRKSIKNNENHENHHKPMQIHAHLRNAMKVFR